MATKKEKLFAKLEEFFSEKRKSKGGYAEVTESDMDNLENIFLQIVELKFERDPDNDLPINWNIIDRTKFQPNHFFNLPYTHKVQSISEMERILDLASGNLHMAMSTFETTLRLYRYDREDKKK